MGDDWAGLVRRGLTGNIIFSIQQARLRDWIRESSDDALRALQEIWTRGNPSVSERIRAFGEQLPESVAKGTGTRLNIMSQLLMGLDVKQFPPFRVRVFDEAYESTEYDRPERDADEAALYEHALGFLDQFIKEASKRGLTLRHRLDAQSMVWAIQQGRGEPTEEEATRTESDLQTLADGLYLPVSFLEEIEALLDDKKQVIFQGPPGTGKTYVAQKLAKHLAGSEERVTLVQLHPSYAYEDFVTGLPSDAETRAGRIRAQGRAAAAGC